MKLKYITTDKCPVCGTDIIIEERTGKEIDAFQIKTHVNGECWEHRRFVCGQEIEYIPNYQAEEMSEVYVCTNNEEYKNKIRKQKEASVQMIQFVESLDVDEDYKKALKNWIR